ncbi:MAG: hypothetical protein CMI54_01875 [Parcubacteria group bacterium]|nr:hypothetical protein [Parcubacteria group bacterium]
MPMHTNPPRGGVAGGDGLREENVDARVEIEREGGAVDNQLQVERDFSPAVFPTGKYSSASELKKRIIFDINSGHPSAGKNVDLLRRESFKLWPTYIAQDWREHMPQQDPEYIFKGQSLNSRLTLPNEPDKHRVRFVGQPFYDKDSEFYEIRQDFHFEFNVSELWRQMAPHGAPLAQDMELTEAHLEALRNERFGMDNPETDAAYARLRNILKKMYGLDTLSMDGDIPLPYEDHACEVPLFWSPIEAQRDGVINNVPIAIIEPEFNYSLLEYEKVLVTAGAPNVLVTDLIPNMYILMLTADNLAVNERALLGEVDSINGTLHRYITLGGQIPLIDSFLQTSFRKSGNLTLQKYYDIWTRTAKRINTILSPAGDFRQQLVPSAEMAGLRQTPEEIRSDLRRLADKFKNILIPAANVKLINQFSNFDESYPMNIGIQFPMDLNKRYANIFVNSKMCSLLLGDVIKDSRPKNFFSYVRAGRTGQRGGPLAGLLDWTFGRSAGIGGVRYKTFDVLDWWRTGEANGQQGRRSSEESLLESDNIVLLGSNDPHDFYSSQEMGSVFYRSLLDARVKSGLRKTIKRYLRSYKDIFDQKLAHSETVFYRIEKILNGEVVKNIYVPNVEGVDMFKYIDTEVLYGRDPNIAIAAAVQAMIPSAAAFGLREPTPTGNKYHYNIYAGQMIIGSNYGRALLSRPGQATAWMGTSQFEETISFLGTTVVRPSVKIVQIPVYMHRDEYPDGTSVLDAPPTPPEVNFVPYRGVDNEILIMMEAPIGEALLERPFSSIDQSEPIDIQSREPHIYRFNNDDLIQSWWAYRTTHKPSSYSEIVKRETIHKTMYTNIPGNPSVNSVSFKDTITPNRKYYYTFMIQDIHGNRSFPSQIYEVEMVNNAGAIYPLINIVDLVPPKIGEPSKSFKKYIKISPSISQKLVNKEDSGLIFGPDEESTAKGKLIALGPYGKETVWGKDFKIRFISKKTGRKFDANFKIKHKLKNAV